MSSLIPFNIFCLRKKFSIEKYIKSFPDSSYEDFSTFLINRRVQPPFQEDYSKVKLLIKENSIEEVKPTVEEAIPIVEEKKAPVKRRRRRTKKKDTSND